MLNKHTKGFQIRYESPVDNKVYEGLFVVKRMSWRDNINFEVLKQKMLQGTEINTTCPHCNEEIQTHNLPEELINFTVAYSHLKIAIVEAPDWFVIDDMQCDPQLLWVIYEKVAEFESTFFRRGGAGEATQEAPLDGGSADKGQKQPEKQRASGFVTPMVDQKVQNAMAEF